MSSDDEIALMTHGFSKVFEEQAKGRPAMLGEVKRCLIVEIRMSCPLFPMQ